MPRLPFLLLIEEKEAKEDQGDDRLQVGRIGTEIFWAFMGFGWIGARGYLGFHGVCPDRCRRFFWLSRGVPGWV